MGANDLHFGLAVRNFTAYPQMPDVDAILAYAERAEALGFESVWVWDHILLGVKPAFPILESLSLLTAIAARTRRIKLGTGVLVLPLRNPVITAKVLSTLDCISKGRLILGVSAGWYAREFDACGIPFKERGKIFERNLELLVRLWTEEAVSGQHPPLNLREAVLLPKPAQRPRPPILIGGYVEAVLKRVAKYSDGWLTYFYTPEGFAKSWAKIEAFAKEFGRDAAQLTSTNQLAILVGPPAAEANERIQDWLAKEWDVASWSDSTTESAIRGTVEECVAQLRRHVEVGLKRFIFIPYRYEPEQVEIIAKEIIPRLRR